MTRWTTLLTATALVQAGLASPALAQSGTMTLPQAVAIALERSPELGQSEQRVMAAEAQRDQAKREWLPKLTAEGVAGIRRLENETRINLGLSNRNEYPLYGALMVEQPIFDTGRRNNAISGLKARLLAAKNNNEQVAEEATYGIARSYLQVLLYERLAIAAAENLVFHDALAADMRVGVEKGAMSISERQQADERRQSARVRLADAENDLQTARNEFSGLIGTSPGSLVMPEGQVGTLPATLDEAVSVAEVNDPKVKEAEAGLAAAEAALRRSKSNGGPTIDLSGSARSGSDFDGYRGQTKSYQALATVRWAFFDGGVNAARIREAEHRAEEARLALIQNQRDSERQVRDSWQKLATWRIKLDEQQARALIARDVHASYRAQFAIGRRSLLDVLDAQTARYSAAVDAEVARVSVRLSEYALLAQSNRLREHFGVSTQLPGASVYGPK
jgi:outer membrane protein, adhesin transport system